MRKLKLIVLFFTLLNLAYANAARELTLINAAPVNGLHKIGTSGLTFCRGKLLTVSDRYSQSIFELDISNGQVTATPYLTFRYLHVPPHGFFQTLLKRMFYFFNKTYDWEGITCDQDQKLYLASETWSSVLKVSQANDIEWLPLPIEQTADQLDIMQYRNAKLEGIAWHPPNQLFLAAERKPRGLMTFSLVNDKWTKTHAQIFSASNTATEKLDFSGLMIDNGKLYTLERRHSLVCRRKLSNYTKEKCWSFGQTEHHPEFAFANVKHGLAEGITKAYNQLFIIYDNNGRARKNNKDDLRPLLLTFELPEDWAD